MIKAEKQRPYCVLFIEKEFRARKARNPAYSIRSFAQFFGIDSGTLSAILNGKRPLTASQATQISQKLELKGGERDRFMESAQQHGQLKKLLSVKPKNIRSFSVEQPEHALLMHWEHYATLALIETIDFYPDPQWIAKRLGITEQKAEETLTRLQDAGLIAIEKTGEIKKTFDDDYTFSNAAAEQYKKTALETVELVTAALQSRDLERSLVFSVTMPVDPVRLAEVKELMIEFQSRLAGLLKGNRPTEVYRLALGLIPLTK